MRSLPEKLCGWSTSDPARVTGGRGRPLDTPVANKFIGSDPSRESYSTAMCSGPTAEHRGATVPVRQADGDLLRDRWEHGRRRGFPPRLCRLAMWVRRSGPGTLQTRGHQLAESPPPSEGDFVAEVFSNPIPNRPVRDNVLEIFLRYLKRMLLEFLDLVGIAEYPGDRGPNHPLLRRAALAVLFDIRMGLLLPASLGNGWPTQPPWSTGFLAECHMPARRWAPIPRTG